MSESVDALNKLMYWPHSYISIISYAEQTLFWLQQCVTIKSQANTIL